MMGALVFLGSFLCRNWVFFWCLRNFLLTARKHPRACPEMSHQSQMSGEKDLWLWACHHVKFLKCQFEGYRGVAVGVGLLTHLSDGLSTVLKRQDCEQRQFMSLLWSLNWPQLRGCQQRCHRRSWRRSSCWHWGCSRTASQALRHSRGGRPDKERCSDGSYGTIAKPFLVTGDMNKIPIQNNYTKLTLSDMLVGVIKWRW